MRKSKKNHKENVNKFMEFNIHIEKIKRNGRNKEKVSNLYIV
jgi:hypothetical protein